MKLNVTFKSDFPVDKAAHPVGEELACYLKDAFCRAGISITLIDNYNDIGWSLDTTVDGQEIFLLLGYIGEGECEWLMQIHAVKKRFLDLFKRRVGIKKCEGLAVPIHEVLCRDKHINTIRWHKGHYSGKDWTERPDV